MPPKKKIAKEDIVKAAVDLMRENGTGAINARALASKLGVSTQPIFSHYRSMEELKADVLLFAHGLYQSFLEQDMAAGKYPVYKASGMAYIRFAREERELFKLLFMRDRSKEEVPEDSQEIKPLLDLICKQTGMSENDARMFHLEMWVYVHGIATMIATMYLEWNEETVSKMLTDCYFGLKAHYLKKENGDGSDPNGRTDQTI